MYHLCSTCPHTSSAAAEAERKLRDRSSIRPRILTSINMPRRCHDEYFSQTNAARSEPRLNRTDGCKLSGEIFSRCSKMDVVSVGAWKEGTSAVGWVMNWLMNTCDYRRYRNNTEACGEGGGALLLNQCCCVVYCCGIKGKTVAISWCWSRVYQHPVCVFTRTATRTCRKQARFLFCYIPVQSQRTDMPLDTRSDPTRNNPDLKSNRKQLLCLFFIIF